MKNNFSVQRFSVQRFKLILDYMNTSKYTYYCLLYLQYFFLYPAPLGPHRAHTNPSTWPSTSSSDAAFALPWHGLYSIFLGLFVVLVQGRVGDLKRPEEEPGASDIADPPRLMTVVKRELKEDGLA